MIYLDYSATTPVNKEVLDCFYDASLKYIGNPNSSHKLGKIALDAINESTTKIKKMLNLSEDMEIIYTSGASEANNLAIKGVAFKNKRKKHIITTLLEHSSVIGPIGYLQSNGFEIDFLKLNEYGQIDIDYLKSIIREDTILVSISSVNSEVGIREQVNEIGKLLKEYNDIVYHVDFTQSIGKEELDFEYVDMFSFSAQKFYGLKGVGALVKKKNIKLEPIIHGGKSTTIYRSGTPAIALILSLEKALELSLKDIKEKYDYVKTLKELLLDYFKNLDYVVINSNEYSIPHIVNISLKNIDSNIFLDKLEQQEIYISSQSACSIKDTPSRIILALTNNQELARSSLRISLSHLTTNEDLETFIKSFQKIYSEITKEV